ncbi:MAG: hypothetical protein ABJB97_05070, partial [Acidobacteriota bacterium]
LQEVFGSAHQVTSQGLGNLAKVYAATKSLGERFQATDLQTSSVEALQRSRTPTTGGSIELKGMARVTDEVRMNNVSNRELKLANILMRNRAHGSDPKVLDGFRPLEGLTASFRSPVKDTSPSTSCDLAKREQLKAATNVVRLKLLAQLPQGTANMRMLDRASSDAIAVAFSGKDFPGRVQRFIRIAKRGYTRAGTVKSDGPAKLSNEAWPDAVDFRMVDRTVAWDPSTVSDDGAADVLHSEGSPDVYLNLPVKLNLKRAGSESEN